MKRKAQIAAWHYEERQPFIGWDFSYLDGRKLEEEPPWSYSGRATELMAQSSSVLDMGTGGGERLLEMRESWPPKVVVTEGHPPNVEIAKERLEPLGVAVVPLSLTRDGAMPFADQEFDLMINRHAAFNCREVARTLARGGTFLTQQVHGLWAKDLFDAFDAVPQWPDSTPQYYVPRLEAAEMHVVTVEEWRGKLAFVDVGALVYFLKAVPWIVPDFSVDAYVDYLFALQRRLERNGELAFEARTYLIEAQKRL
ncbi:MAG: methyltransferase domain-containing protein [Pseudomonadales bacterium]